MATVYVTPPWILENESETRPIDMSFLISLKVGPVWSHDENRGGWYAAIILSGCNDLDIEDLWSCGHCHAEKNNAWVCAARAVAELSERCTQH